MPSPASTSSLVDSYQQCLDYCFEKTLTNCAERCGPEEAQSNHRTVQAFATITNPYTLTGLWGTGLLVDETGGWPGAVVTTAALLIPVGTSAYYHYGEYSAGEESAARSVAHIAGDAAVSVVAHVGGTIAGMVVGLGIMAGVTISDFDSESTMAAVFFGGALARTATTAGIVYYLTDPMEAKVDYFIE
ncbi:MAG: hypothetical protein HY541_05850 [Deltaproteobacteria bacterium]|nr:hypothetical protein [Deltaproteobacteria bacterium]